MLPKQRNHKNSDSPLPKPQLGKETMQYYNFENKPKAQTPNQSGPPWEHERVFPSYVCIIDSLPGPTYNSSIIDNCQGGHREHWGKGFLGQKSLIDRHDFERRYIESVIIQQRYTWHKYFLSLQQINYSLRREVIFIH